MTPVTVPVHDMVASVAESIANEQKAPSIAPSLTFSDDSEDQDELPKAPPQKSRHRRASTRLIAQNARDIQRITGETTAEFVQRCCGGGCCLGGSTKRPGIVVEQPDNEAYRSLGLAINEIPLTLTKVPDLPESTVSFIPIARPAVDSLSIRPAQAAQAAQDCSPTDSAVSLGSGSQSPVSETASAADEEKTEGESEHDDDDGNKDEPTMTSMASCFVPVDTAIQPPRFVQPHPPYHVHPVRIHNTRELTKPGAEKRTYHFDLDITDYPNEDGSDFVVGGAIGIMAPNSDDVVEDVLDTLMVPRFQRDKPVLMRTTKGRWPTVWGDEKARSLVTTRRDLFRWTVDLQSFPPTKAMLRLLAEHAAADNERKILEYLCSAEGQGVFCDFRTGPHVSVSQVLHAFPSAHPPLGDLLSVLPQLMPRFYSLSNDPHEAYETHDDKQHRLVQVAVTVHETHDWKSGKRTGVGSGFFERQAHRFLEETRLGRTPDLYVPMFKGLMANPLAKQFKADGPMLLIGAGVGIAPFRGFVQRRLKQANCANKVWVLQGIRDSLVDEIYSGEWGVHEDEVKRVVQSRRGEGRYVQEEVRHQADLVWQIVNSIDGRIFVCGSSRGMGEGVEEALVDVAMAKGNLQREEARNFWDLKKEAGQYIAETW
ncbi:Sulfite reductase, alpha subunit (flavoprotein) [Geosmithia morbida]|uniref:Sulfite reductase, alpha subunit (Flavoprotein) n=1 Tax=Geosmithia morbida TaxID=1094350 RepID=A0A9P4YRJ8_9HYPO|nr:Sulfite reductase, alpha subunit (flavoprotein) [Geosmithia morbida]KAF4121808.1 Sulfite reductase, alpha subunit (flavoprotein) [Geosmithia morbida]